MEVTKGNCTKTCGINEKMFGNEWKEKLIAGQRKRIICKDDFTWFLGLSGYLERGYGGVGSDALADRGGRVHGYNVWRRPASYLSDYRPKRWRLVGKQNHIPSVPQVV